MLGIIGDKRRWRSYKARVEALPADHRTVAEALERYLVQRGTVTTGDALVAMLVEVAERFERAGDAPVREIVGTDAVGFADGLLAKYGRRDAEQQRLVDAIAGVR